MPLLLLPLLLPLLLVLLLLSAAATFEFSTIFSVYFRTDCCLLVILYLCFTLVCWLVFSSAYHTLLIFCLCW